MARDRNAEPDPNNATPDAERAGHPRFGNRPSVGQSESYQSGGQAHGKSERSTRSDATAGGGADSGPHHDKGWPSRSPSKKY